MLVEFNEHQLGLVLKRIEEGDENEVSCTSFLYGFCSTYLSISLSRGDLKIAEVTSRISDVQEFIELVESIGFSLISKVCGISFRNLYLY